MKLKVGGPSITPEQVVASGQAQIGIDWLPSLLATRDTGTNLVNIAQMFARSGMTEIARKSTRHHVDRGDAEQDGRRLVLREPVRALCRADEARHGPEHNKGVKIFNQPFDMDAFLQGKIQAAAAMTYNELAQVLESKNPATGKLYTLNDLNVFKLQNEGTGMLEDGLFADQSWVSEQPRRRDAVHRGVRPRLDLLPRPRPAVHEHRAPERPDARQGAPDVADERDQQAHLAELEGDRGHGSGRVQADGRDRAQVQGDQEAGLDKAYDATLAKAALQYLKNHVKGIDVNGKSYKPITVKLTAGGK